MTKPFETVKSFIISGIIAYENNSHVIEVQVVSK